MGILSRDEDTICAVCTPPGVGGIAVLRVSGSAALEVSRRVCPFLPKDSESHRVYYGFARSCDGGQDLDEVLATYFAAGRSFTGESTVEISCHGGLVVTDQILQELMLAGARLAERGEFTYRAFINQRVDLVQAESILNLIEATSRRSSNLALRQLKGDLSKFVSRLEDSIHWVLAHLEANIDFAAEDIEVAPHGELVERLTRDLKEVENALASYADGRMLREGLRIAIVGPPNAGKSSLMNALIGEQRSIVTAIPGTTRDTVEGSMLVNGVCVTFVDTAGLRETEDLVEQLGIERAHVQIAEADVVLLVVDLSDLVGARASLARSDFQAERLWVIGNKSDLIARDELGSALTKWCDREFGPQVCGQSAIKSIVANTVDCTGLDALHRAIGELTEIEFSEVSAVLTNRRHQELFESIRASMEQGLRLATVGESPEFVAFELRSALMGIHELVGRQFDDDVLDRVFKEFCLGK